MCADLIPRETDHFVVGLNWITQVLWLMRCRLPILYWTFTTSLQAITALTLVIVLHAWMTITIPEDSYWFRCSLRHQPASARPIYSKFINHERRTWLRLHDPASNRRTLSADSHRILSMFLFGCNLCPCQMLTSQTTFGMENARLMQICQIGGFIKFPSGTTFDDFAQLGLPVKKEMQTCIASFETLQCRLRFCGGAIARERPTLARVNALASLDRRGAKLGFALLALAVATVSTS